MTRARGEPLLLLRSTPERPRSRVSRQFTWIVALACLALGSRPVAAHESPRIRFYDGEDGLSQLSVKSIAQTPDGALWVGTWSGLNRFDGGSFTVFGESDGLPHDRVQALATDPDGTLWIGTLAGLARTTPDGFEWVREEGVLGIDAVQTIQVAADGTVFVGDDRGLVEIAPGQSPRRSRSIETSVTGVAVDRSGEVWAVTKNAVWCSTHGRSIDDLVEVEGVSPVEEAYALHDGRMILMGERGFLLLKDGRIALEISEDSLGRRVQAQSVHVDRTGLVRVGTFHGVFELRGERLVPVFQEIDDTALRIIDVLFEDREGALWAGGYGGIIRIAGPAFENHAEREGLPSPNVRPVLRGPNGDLWAGTLAGLARYDGEGWQTYTTRDGLGHGTILSLLMDSKHRLWVGHQAGVSVYEGEEFRTIDGLSTASYLEEDSEGRLWVATSADGMWILDPESESVSPMPIPGGGGTGVRMLCTSDGAMWVSTRAGLCRYSEGEWDVYSPEDGMAAPEPYFLAEGERGSIWLGYHAAVGVSKFDGSEFTTYSTRDGLSHDSVYSIGRDRDGNMWFGSARGVDRFDGTSFRNYSAPDGYANPESNSGGFFVDYDGSLWFGTAGGLSHYRPELDRALDVPLLIEMRDLQIGYRELLGPMRVGHDTDDLSAWISVYTSVDERALAVETRITGLDAEWRATPRGAFQLPNLPSGRYRLELRARRYQEPWTEARSPEFTILPPLYLQWPFLLVCSLGLVALVILAILWNTRRVRRQNQALQLAVREATAELSNTNEELARANEAKSAFMANVSHEIRTPMNAVLGMTELVLDSQLNDEQHERLVTVQSSGEHLLQLINDILDVSKIESGRFELDPSPVDARELVRSVVRTTTSTAHRKGLRLEYDIDPAIPERILADELRLRQVLINLVGNAVKFTARGHVIVSVDSDPGAQAPAGHTTLRFAVRDSGVGIANDRLESIFDSFVQEDVSTTRRFGGTGLGLTIARQLVELMGGKLEVESEPGRGSRFQFDLTAPIEAQAGRDEPWPQLGQASVVVAESGAECRATIARKIERRAECVVVAESGPALVESLALLGEGSVALIDPELPQLADALDQLRDTKHRLVLAIAPGNSEELELRSHPAIETTLDRPVSAASLEETLARPLRSARPSGGSTESPDPDRREKLNVLVAEDNPVNQKLMVALVQRLGHEVILAADGVETIDAWSKDDYDVILMDMQMPRMDGLEATREIRRLEAELESPRISIIALTANAMVGDRERCLESGMDDYLSKPVRRAELEAALRRAAVGTTKEPALA